MQTKSGNMTVHVDPAWTAYAPLENQELLLSTQEMLATADVITIGSSSIKAHHVQAVRGQHDFKPMFVTLFEEKSFRKVVYVFVPVHADVSCHSTLGLGGDCQIEAWLNGKKVLENCKNKDWDGKWPPAFDDQKIDVDLKAGKNMLVVRLIGGIGSALLAVGGPDDLAPAHFQSILSDPFFTDARWMNEEPCAVTGDKPVVNIESQLEMFIDDFLIDSMAGAVERRLAAPVSQGAVFHADQRWEEAGVNYFSIVHDPAQGSMNLYYSARPKDDPSLRGKAKDEGRYQFTCVLESSDGVNFTRPEMAMVEFEGSKANNIILRGTPSHNFSPFLDTNPAARPDEKFKAVAYHTKGKGLGAFASADGLHWRLMCEEKIITQGKFDSHNLAYWDTNIGQYVCYYRDSEGGLRRIIRATSADFIHWSPGHELTYSDSRPEHMYTNGIFSYPNAPHLYIGLANRFVPQRTKVPAHPYYGLNDTIMMSSRDGKHFDRWEEGYIRPTSDWQNWTDRNLYAAWGLAATGANELSVYWTEHNRYPSMRLMRGTVRKDGFASLHAPGNAIGEVLTRPIVFTGSSLLLNYATSVIGSIRVGLCDASGKPIAGFEMKDSWVLFGNEFEHVVTWRGQSDLSKFASQAVRLRIRLHDADLYAIRFA